MNRLTPSDLSLLPSDFTDAGHALFGRSIKVSLFGEEDVVSFFRQKEDYKSLLKRLERVHDEVQGAHAEYVEVRMTVRIRVGAVVRIWMRIIVGIGLIVGIVIVLGIGVGVGMRVRIMKKKRIRVGVRVRMRRIISIELGIGVTL